VGPVQSIEAVVYKSPEGGEATLDPAMYELTGVGIDRGIELAPASSWPAIAAGRGVVSVTLDVGYGEVADVPQNLRFAVFALLRGKFEGREVSIAPLIVNDRIGA